MNIIEAYIKYRGQFVIIISGISGCGKTDIGERLAQSFNISLINQINYYTIQDKNIYSDDNINWSQFLDDIFSKKTKGVVVIGMSFPTLKMGGLKIDYHIHLKIPKQECLEYRKTQYGFTNEQEINADKLFMNNVIFPYYIKTLESGYINKYIATSQKSLDVIFDEIFDSLIEMIKKFLYSPQNNNFRNKNNNNNIGDKENKSTINNPVKFVLQTEDNNFYPEPSELDCFSLENIAVFDESDVRCEEYMRMMEEKRKKIELHF
jgi:hypothetical protein